MAYTHKINRYEKYRDSEWNITSIYINIESSDWITTQVNDINLNRPEREAVVTDSDNIKELLLKYIANIEEELDLETEKTPFPTIIASQEERESILNINRAKINKNRQNIRLDKAKNK